MSFSETSNPWADVPATVSDSPWNQPLGKTLLRRAQIIVGALVAGGAVFMAVVVGLGSVMPDRPPQAPVMTYAAVALALTALLVRWVFPAMLERRVLEAIREGNWNPPGRPGQEAAFSEFTDATGDAGRMCLLFLQHTVIAAALVEGPVLMLLVSYTIEGAPLALASAAVLLALLASHLPTRAHAEAWVERRLARLDRTTGWAA